VKTSPFKRQVGTLTAVAGAVLVLSAQAQAQTQTVTVTGIRSAIESAISVKKNADNVVEAISAEDIGKLPDTSVAESISRLPGVAAQRTAGRAQQISIRGMAPDFSTALLNGREQVTTGDSRGVEFDQYPSELLSGVVIYKTPDGALLGQGLSGTVDLQTIRPLDSKQKGFAVNYRKTQLGVGTTAEGKGERVSVSYVNSFADRKVGLAVGFARLDENGPKTERFDSWGGGTAKLNNAGADINVPYNGFGWFQDQTTQTRDGAMAVLQIKPTPNYSTSVDLFYSKFDKISATKGFQAPLNDSWAGGTYDKGGVLTAATVAGGKATAGTFNNVRAVVRNDSTSQFDEMTSFGWNHKLKLGKDWTLNADLNQSKAERTGGIIETTAGTAQSVLGTATLDSVQFTDAAKFTPGLNYADRNIIKLTDVQGWGGGTGSPQAGYSKLPNVSDDLQAVKLSAKGTVAWGLVNTLEAGVNLTDREKKRAFREGRLVIKGDTTGLGSATVPGAETATVAGIPIVSWDPSQSVGTVYDIAAKVHPDIYNKDWTVKEKVTTFFAKGDLDTKLFGKDVRGNVGAQVVMSDQSSSAFNVDRDGCKGDTPAACPAATTAQGRKYTDVLPSLNLVMDLGGDQTLRLGLAKVLARPTMNDMRASLGISYDATKNILNGSGGNPNLEPFRANALDLSYEKYIGTKAYFGVAGFYKDLQTYILNRDITYDFKPFVTASTKLPTGVANPTVGRLYAPVNGSGGSIRGVELSASLPLDVIAKPLSGFGLQVNHSDTSSSINLATAGLNTDGIATSSIPLPGLSKRVTNVTVYYEKSGFGFRVAQRSRSDFIGEVSDFTGDRKLTYVKGEAVMDAQLSYEVQRGMLKGLSVLFQASNINNAEFVRYRDTPSNVVERVKYGKSYLLGVNYKL